MSAVSERTGEGAEQVNEWATGLCLGAVALVILSIVFVATSPPEYGLVRMYLASFPIILAGLMFVAGIVLFIINSLRHQ